MERAKVERCKTNAHGFENESEKRGFFKSKSEERHTFSLEVIKNIFIG